MPKLKDLLTKFGELTGQSENPELQALIGASGLEAFDVSDDLANGILGKVLTVETAKNNLDLKTHFVGQFAQGVNQNIEENAKEIGATQEELLAIRNEKGTSEKVKVYNKIFSRLQAEAAKKGNSEEFVRKVQEAEARTQAVEAEYKAKMAEQKSQWVSKLAEKSLAASLTGIQWNDAIPEIARVPSFQAALNAELTTLGGKLIFDDSQFEYKIVNAQDETLPVMLQNKPVAFNDLMSLTLQKNKFLKEAGSGGGGNPPNPVNPQGNPKGQNPGTLDTTPRHISQIRAETQSTYAAMRNLSE